MEKRRKGMNYSLPPFLLTCRSFNTISAQGLYSSLWENTLLFGCVFCRLF
uniref:Uncharacterized protein n=1 Tax=Anguilla anguilla TaxID=7936 RepID=A0A0E9VHP5_ANGAN